MGRYFCNATMTEAGPPPSFTFSWSKSVTPQCCQTCNGTVVPEGTVVGDEFLEDDCKTVKTSVCKSKMRGKH